MGYTSKWSPRPLIFGLIALTILLIISIVVVSVYCVIRSSGESNYKSSHLNRDNTDNLITIPHNIPPGVTFLIKNLELVQNEVNVQNSAQRLFPQNLFQTYKSNQIPKNMACAISTWKNKNPSFNYIFMDDDRSKQFICKNFPHKYWDAVDILKPGAYKADIIRLCCLFVHGGWYCDISSVCDKNIMSACSSLSMDTKLVVCKDVPASEFAVYQAFIGCTKENPVIKFILDHIIEDVHNRKFVNDSLMLTGPGAFGQYLNMYYEKPKNTKINCGYSFNGTDTYVAFHDKGKISLTDDLGRAFITTKYENWIEDRKKGSHYSIMFKNGEVFNPVVNHTNPTEQELKRVSSLSEKDGKIPPIIFQSWENLYLSPNVTVAFNSWGRRHPKMMHVIHNSSQRRSFIADNFSTQTLLAYDIVRPGAFKCDIWRLCVLLKYGGVYADIDSFPSTSVMDLIENMYIKKVKWVASVDANRVNIANGFILAVKNNEFLQFYLDIIVQRIINREKVSHDVMVTGPGAMKEAWVKFFHMDKGKLPDVGYSSKTEGYLLNYDLKKNVMHDENGVAYIHPKINGYDDNRCKNSGNIYSKLFMQGKTYYTEATISDKFLSIN